MSLVRLELSKDFQYNSKLHSIDVSLLDPRQPLVRQHPTWFWCISRVTSMKNNLAAPIIPYTSPDYSIYQRMKPSAQVCTCSNDYTLMHTREGNRDCRSVLRNILKVLYRFIDLRMNHLRGFRVHMYNQDKLFLCFRFNN